MLTETNPLAKDLIKKNYHTRCNSYQTFTVRTIKDVIIIFFFNFKFNIIFLNKSTYYIIVIWWSGEKNYEKNVLNIYMIWIQNVVIERAFTRYKFAIYSFKRVLRAVCHLRQLISVWDVMSWMKFSD